MVSEGHKNGTGIHCGGGGGSLALPASWLRAMSTAPAVDPAGIRSWLGGCLVDDTGRFGALHRVLEGQCLLGL